MGDAAGEDPEALELLGVKDLLLEAQALGLRDLALGDVLDRPEHPDRPTVAAEFEPAEAVDPALLAVADAPDPVFPVERPAGRKHLARKVGPHLLPLVGVDDLRPPGEVPDIVRVDPEDVVEHGRTAPRARDDVEFVVADPRHVLRLVEPGLALAQRPFRAREIEVFPDPVHQQIELGMSCSVYSDSLFATPTTATMDPSRKTGTVRNRRSATCPSG